LQSQQTAQKMCGQNQPHLSARRGCVTMPEHSGERI